MKQEDTRVQYTKERLKRTLIALLKTRQVGSIKVTELCEAAGINRGTFYLHYASPEDVLCEIQRDFLKETLDFNVGYWAKDHDEKYFIQLLTLIKNNPDTFRAVVGKNGNADFIETMYKQKKDQAVREWKKEYPGCTDEQLSFSYKFTYYGIVQLLLDWIDNRMDLSAEVLISRISTLSCACLEATRQFGGNTVER